MKSESVQETLQSIHAHQHTESESEETQEACPECKSSSSYTVILEGNNQDIFQEHTG